MYDSKNDSNMYCSLKLNIYSFSETETKCACLATKKQIRKMSESKMCAVAKYQTKSPGDLDRGLYSK